MKKLFFPAVLFLSAILLLINGCSGNKKEVKQEAVLAEQVSEPVVVGNETTLLLKNLEENGDYVNSQLFPSLIKASIVNANLEKNQLVIDLRPSVQFSEGHIKGAVNKKMEELPAYFETGIKPFEYEKIIFVCEGGQTSSYVVSLLRLMGYGNVFAMRWGMSAWNDTYAENGWFKGVSGKFEANLESTTNDKPLAKGMPELKTGKTSGEEIGAERFRTLFEEGNKNILISADEVFANPQNFFIINLDRKDKYEDGHIPGAVRFKPDETLSFTQEMASIPFDKTVVVYCGTGHNSGFASAYLRLFGYDARTLKYGNNSFMYDRMITQRVALSWLPFTKDDVNDFKIVK